MVKVKLTDFGILILKRRHEELSKSIKIFNGKALGDFVLNLDENGYYRTQLWILMDKFGSVMSMAHEMPFYTDIIIEDGEPING